MSNTALNIQEDYYKKTAVQYDSKHILSSAERGHDFNLFFLSSMIKLFNIKTILDVGAGTGRTISFLKSNHPDIKIIGIEPVKELREQGYQKGILQTELIEGDGYNMPFQENEFDLVCEFGMLHHVALPSKVVSEMIRVSKIGIFISDSNNFGQGGYISRSMKQLINFLGLWRTYNLIRTRGKGYQISEGDGLFYSYSVFNNLKQIKKRCSKVYLVGSKDSNGNLYRTAPDIGLMAVKKKI